MRKSDDPNIALRQEEIREILGVVPPWVIRWGSLTLAVVFIGLIIGTIWFKYPDKISSRLSLTLSNPPVVLNARQSGRIELLYIRDTSIVKKGQLMAVLESSARIADVLEIDSLLTNRKGLLLHPDSLSLFAFSANNYQLGECQASLAAFVKSRQDLIDFNKQGSNQARIAALKKQLRDYKLLYDRQYRLRQIKSDELNLQEKQYQRLVALHDSNAISSQEFESGSSAYLKARYEVESARSTLSETQIEMDQVEQEIINIDKNYLEAYDQKVNLLSQTYGQLSGSISDWKLKYAFIAPVDGMVSFTRIWSQNQFVKEGERVLTIITGEPGPVLGKVLLPLTGAGKVHAGQKVIVKVDKYPYMEYGMLRGKVESISKVSDQDFYSVEVSFPNGMKSSYNKDLELSQGMTGEAEILTDELSLLVRVINPLRSILKRNDLIK